MEQILTTAALIVGGIVAVWILFSDTLGEDGKSGQMDTTLLFAFLMIPLIVAVLIGIVLFLPVLLGIILVLALAYGAYQALQWLLTREREEKGEKRENGEGRFSKALRKMRESFSSVWNAQATRRMRERTKEATVAVRTIVQEKRSRRHSDRADHFQSVGRKITDTRNAEDDELSHQKEQSSSVRSRHTKWRSALRRNPQKRGVPDPSASGESHMEENSMSHKNPPASERGHAHDPLANMRRIGWSTRRHLGDVHHHWKGK